MAKININDRVRVIKKPSTMGLVTGVSGELGDGSKEQQVRRINVLVDGFATSKFFDESELEHIPKDDQSDTTSPAQPVPNSGTPQIAQPNPPGDLFCAQPVLIIFGGDKTQPCGRPASVLISVEVLGVKVIMERPMCMTCGQNFVQSGFKIAMQPLGEIVAAHASALEQINKLKKN